VASLVPTILLGPQRFHPDLRQALDSLDNAAPLAVVTAGWQEREDEIEELSAHVGRPVVNLRLYARAEAALAADPALADAMRALQEDVQRQQELYRTRLAHALEAARTLLRRTGGGRLLDEHRRAAIRAVQLLDRQHVVSIARRRAAFDAGWEPIRRPAVAAVRERLAAELSRTGALAIAGGHVAVLLNRMRLFDVIGLARALPVVAWSAGAMALSERVVLFHDSPPQGPGDAEVLEAGLGRVPGVVVLPHARRRLRLDEPSRVALLARRFAPAVCIRFDAGARLSWDGRQWRPGPGTERLDRTGALSVATGP
jgi:hypothetical protein